MSGTSYFSTSSSTGVVNKAERDKGPQRRYLISAALALIAFDSVVSWRDTSSLSRSLVKDPAFLESAGARGETYREAVRWLADRP
jgi:hypothetical protein